MQEPRSVRGISGVDLDVAIAFFERKGISRTIARSYGITLLETARASGRDITDIFRTTSSGQEVLIDDALARLNFLRPMTSQVGFRQQSEPIQNFFIRRSIIA